jgi:hypothetical protein
LLLIEATLTEEGITNDPEIDRKMLRLEEAEKAGTNFVATFVQRFTVRTLKFIRWLRNFVYRKASWSQATARLGKAYAQT